MPATILAAPLFYRPLRSISYRKDNVKEEIKVVFDPPCLMNRLEFVYSEDGKTIEGWKWLGWKEPKAYENQVPAGT